MEKKVIKEISALVVESLDDILQLAYLNKRTGICSVIYDVDEQVLLHLIRRDVICETLDRHTSTYFNFDDADAKVFGQLFSTNSFITPIAVVILCINGKDLTVRSVSIKIQEELIMLIQDTAAKEAM